MKLRRLRLATMLRSINCQQWLKVCFPSKPNLRTNWLLKSNNFRNSTIKSKNSMKNLLLSVSNELLRLNRRERDKGPVPSPKELLALQVRINRAWHSLRKILTLNLLQRNVDLKNKPQNRPSLMLLRLKLRKLASDKKKRKNRKLKKQSHLE